MKGGDRGTPFWLQGHLFRIQGHPLRIQGHREITPCSFDYCTTAPQAAQPIMNGDYIAWSWNLRGLRKWKFLMFWILKELTKRLIKRLITWLTQAKSQGSKHQNSRSRTSKFSPHQTLTSGGVTTINNGPICFILEALKCASLARQTVQILSWAAPKVMVK